MSEPMDVDEHVHGSDCAHSHSEDDGDYDLCPTFLTADVPEDASL